MINSSPFSLDNNFANGAILINGGAGGSGYHGGAGGSVTTFSMTTTVKDLPAYSFIVAGTGGNATVGAGGAGGSVSGINVSASGSPYYNRIVAGAQLDRHRLGLSLVPERRGRGRGG